MTNNPFEGLKITPKPQKSTAINVKAEKPFSQEKSFLEGQDFAYFSQAMSGVKPLKEANKKITISTPPAFKKRPENALKHIDFETETQGDFLCGHLCGLDPQKLRMLKSGDFPIESRLDMHKMTKLEAYTKLLATLKQAYRQKKRYILTLPGKGNHSATGIGILREELPSWLIKEPLNHIVLAFCSAQPRHGGSGAVYILLRKYKEQDDKKINWNKSISLY